MKSYTDIEQSRKLAKILSVESADMFYSAGNETQPTFRLHSYGHIISDKDICAWSLAALLDVIPKHIKYYIVLRIDISENDTSIWYDEIGCGVNNNLPDITMESAVDACVAMIEKLHELNLL